MVLLWMWRRLGKVSQSLKTSKQLNDVQKKQLQAAAQRSVDRDDLAKRLHDDTF